MTAPTYFDQVDTPRMRAFRRRVTILSAGGTFLDGYDLTVIAIALPAIAANGRSRPARRA